MLKNEPWVGLVKHFIFCYLWGHGELKGCFLQTRLMLIFPWEEAGGGGGGGHQRSLFEWFTDFKFLLTVASHWALQEHRGLMRQEVQPTSDRNWDTGLGSLAVNLLEDCTHYKHDNVSRDVCGLAGLNSGWDGYKCWEMQTFPGKSFQSAGGLWHIPAEPSSVTCSFRNLLPQCRGCGEIMCVELLFSQINFWVCAALCFSSGVFGPANI